MHLTQQTDLSLRILLYLAMRPGEAVAVREISEMFRLPEGYAAKVAKQMVRDGLLLSKRGRLGGVMLAHEPSELRLGQLVGRLEPISLFDCLTGESDCPIAPACILKGALSKATQAFLESLDRHTLADLVKNKHQLVQLLGKKAP